MHTCLRLGFADSERLTQLRISVINGNESDFEFACGGEAFLN